MSVAVKFDPVRDETKLRPVIDLSRHVNKCTKVSHVKLDDLSLAEELICKDDFMASFDLANQFFHVRLHEDDRKFFGFALPAEDGHMEYYQFKVMAYGYSPAVEVVTRLLKPVKVYLHQLGIKISIFVDDGRISASSKEECSEKFEFALTVLQLCGWNIQWKKTSTEAVQSLLHLGFVTDSVQLRYFLPVEKEKIVMQMLRQTIEQACQGKKVAALEMAKLLGKLNSMRRSHGPGLGVLTRTCQHLLGASVEEAGWQTEVQLTYEAVRELTMLVDCLESLNGQHIFSTDARSKIFELSETDRLTQLIRTTDEQLQNLFVSDASDSHVFIYRADGTFQFVKEFEFTETESSASSGYRELLAVQKTLESDPGQFAEFSGGVVYWQTDSKNCYSFLSRGSRVTDVQSLVMDIKHRERKLDIKIIPVWTPRSHERIVLADLGSKMSSSTDEWCIDREDLSTVFSVLKYTPDFDCMATRSNSVCKRFYSKIPQIGSQGVNFLCQDLRTDCNYFCCPPIKMVGQVVRHLLEKKNVNCLLVLPVWPSAVFWVSLHQNSTFCNAVVKTHKFQPKFFMSNGAQSLFARNPHFEMIAYVLKS
jgi:hypothetical protein